MNKPQAKKASPSQIFKDENGVVSPVIDKEQMREMVRDIVDGKVYRN
jgi:hypothetical protein